MAEGERGRDDGVGRMIRLEPVGGNVPQEPIGVERQPVSIECAGGSFWDFPECLAIIDVKRADFNAAAIGSMSIAAKPLDVAAASKVAGSICKTSVIAQAGR